MFIGGREIPTVYVVGGLAVVAVGLYYYRKKSSMQNQSQSFAPPSEASVQQDLGYTSNVTDTSNQVPWEMTWPYNQLALPYNYTAPAAQVVSQNAQLVLPSTDAQNSNFPGYNSTSTAFGLPSPFGMGANGVLYGG